MLNLFSFIYFNSPFFLIRSLSSITNLNKSNKPFVSSNTINIRNQMELPSFLDQVLIGICLGDGFFEKSGSHKSNVRFKLTFAERYSALANYIYGLFCYYINPKGYYKNKVQSGLNSKFYGRIQLTSVALPVFNKYHNLFYKLIGAKYIKVIPLNIEELLTPISLAFFIMGDGNYHKTKKIIRLSIFNKFGIESRLEHVRDNQFILRISRNQVPLIQNLVKSHMHPTLLYRIGLPSTEQI